MQDIVKSSWLVSAHGHPPKTKKKKRLKPSPEPQHLHPKSPNPNTYTQNPKIPKPQSTYTQNPKKVLEPQKNGFCDRPQSLVCFSPWLRRNPWTSRASPALLAVNKGLQG